MRILHWAETYLPIIGGGEIFIQNLTESLEEKGHQNFIFSNPVSGLVDREKIGSSTVFRHPFQSTILRRDLSSILRLEKHLISLVRDINPDVVHLHTFLGGAFFYLKLRKTNPVRTIFSTHIPIHTSGTGIDMLGKVVGNVDAVAAISAAMKDEILTRFPEVSGRTVIILNSLPIPSQSPTNIELSFPVFLMLGRLVAEKGGAEFISAFSAVVKEVPDAKAIVAGDGPERENLLQKVRALGIQEHVNFTGWIPPEDVPALLNRVACVVVPSFYESFGLVALQAMQMGRPVIASDVGGLPEMVTHGKTGLLVPPGNPETLAKAMLELAKDSQKANALGQAAAVKASTEFSWESCVSSYLALYQEIR